ncbi:MAG: hypothetical protein Q8R33_15560 [Burkholderiales bacterium]|nr:hypothetical protein [Burkholderiales bacterium]
MTAAAPVTLHAALRISRIKRVAGMQAQVALLGGTLTESHDDHGREALILTVGALTVEGNADAIEELLEQHFGVLV